MEGREDLSFGVTVKDGLTESYRIAPRNENSNQFGALFPPPAMVTPTATAPATAPSPAPAPATAPAPAPLLIPAVSPVTAASPVSAAATTTTDGKKKRGRPRKYGPDGKLALPLCPMPISSSVPLTDFSAWKRGKGRPNDSIKKSHKHEPEVSGEKIAYYVGANFTPHMITVNAGEDVSMKIMLFSQQGARAICILSANGMISNVTLRQPTSSGGTLTYEGRFEILSLSGSFMPTENGGAKSRSGGMSVSLAGPDGRVLGGGLAGLLVAAGPVQVVVGSFLPGHQQEQKPKKQRTENASAVIRTNANPIFGEDLKGVYGGAKPILTSFNGTGDNSANLNPPMQEEGLRNSTVDNTLSSSGEESKGHSQSN